MTAIQKAKKYLEETPQYVVDGNDTTGYASRLVRDLMLEITRLKIQACDHGNSLQKAAEKEEKTVKEYIEKVAAGLREMKQKPDAFLFCSNGEITWDEPTILGIPVFQSALILNTSTDEDVPFIPLWENNGDYSLSRRQFNDGYIL